MRSRGVCAFCGRELPVVEYEFAGVVRMRPGACACPASLAEQRRDSVRRMSEESDRARGVAEALLRKAGIPPNYLDVPVPDGIFLDAGGCWIFGPSGSGKTAEAAAFAAREVLAGKSVRFTSLKRIAREMNDARRGGGAVGEVVGKYVRCDLLVLDDLGKEGFTESTARTLFEIIDRRYFWGLPTLVTSNYSPGALTAKVAAVDASAARGMASRMRGRFARVETGGGEKGSARSDGVCRRPA